MSDEEHDPFGNRLGGRGWQQVTAIQRALQHVRAQEATKELTERLTRHDAELRAAPLRIRDQVAAMRDELVTLNDAVVTLLRGQDATDQKTRWLVRLAVASLILTAVIVALTVVLVLR